MDLIQEYNNKYKFFRDITGVAMLVHRKYHPGLLESAYEAAMKYLLEQQGRGKFFCQSTGKMSSLTRPIAWILLSMTTSSLN